MSLYGETGTQLTMPVMPAGMGGYGMGGFGGDGWWGILFILAIMCGGWGGFGGFGGMGGMMGMWPFLFGGNGFNGGGSASAQGALTREQACIDNNFQNLMRETAGISDAVNVGFANLNSTICHQQYDTAMLVNGVNNNITQGFHGVDNAICNLGYQTQNGFNAANVVALQNQNALQAQLADCCCKNLTGQMQIGNQIERGFCQTNYNDATNTNAIIQNAHNDTDRVLAKLDAMEMARKDETIAAQNQKIFGLELAASQANQNSYLVNQLRPCPQPAYLTCNPFTGQTYGYGQYNGGCGCNTGCCGCNG